MKSKLFGIYEGDCTIEAKETSHHGELLQGIFEGENGQLHRGLITLKCNLFTSTAIFIKEPGLNEIKIMPEHKTKALNAAKATLEYFGIDRNYGGYLILKSDIPEEMGFGSSTSDVVASIRAIATAIDMTLTPTEIAQIAVNSENASDAIMFKECVLFAQREGRILKKYGKPIPPMHVIGFSSDEKGISTLEHEPANYNVEEIKSFKVLKGLWECAIEEQNTELIGRVASASAVINQKYLPKPNFNRILEIAEKTKALGVQVAHSGTLVGLLYQNEILIEEKIIEVKKYLKEIGITKAWYFNTMEDYLYE